MLRDAPAGTPAAKPAWLFRRRHRFTEAAGVAILEYALRMKSKLVIKCFIVVVFAVLLGEFIQLDYEKWHRLGREAFLTYQGHRFDLHMADPVHGPAHLLVFAMFALGWGALYEGVAFAGTKLVSRILPGKSPSPGISS
jgi:hypothetical protein